MEPPAASRASTSSDQHGRTVWIDASAGVAGDMLLAALVDAGASIERVQAAVDALLPDTIRLRTAETSRSGLRALKVDVDLLRAGQPDRPWSEVRDLISRAPLAPAVAQSSLAAFEALARVEADVHGVEVGQVHFHEVGAWDSIADVVGSCAALADLGVDLGRSDVVVSVIAVGSGSVSTAHGRIPVPVPAVLGLSVGWAVEALGEGELATPTGVALVTTLASRQAPLPPMEVAAIGVGAGTKDVPGRANVVRVVIGTPVTPREQPLARTSAGPGGVPAEDLLESELVLLEANVDDLDPRVWPSVLTTLLERGAADAWLTPIVMKKGRPAHTLSVLASPEQGGSLRDVVLAETSTIGVRATSVRRWAVRRLWGDVRVEGQRVRIKVARRNGLIVQATPEFADVEAAAAVLQRPVRDVLEAAGAAAAAAGLVPGAHA